MSAQPARHPPPARAARAARPRQRPAAAGRPARIEQRRRRRHLQQLRRDALVDFIAAFALMIVVLIATAGLGVVALLEIPVALAVIASVVAERRRR
jgi:uncharacterized protein YjiS (DUF1127 family)